RHLAKVWGCFCLVEVCLRQGAALQQRACPFKVARGLFELQFSFTHSELVVSRIERCDQCALGHKSTLLYWHVDDAPANLERQVDGVDRINPANKVSYWCQIRFANLIEAYRARFMRDQCITVAVATLPQKDQHDQPGQYQPAIAAPGRGQTAITRTQIRDRRRKLTRLRRSSASNCSW